MSNPSTKASKAAVNAATSVESAVDEQISDFEKQILAQLEGWEQVETGFPPYWKPVIGEIITCKVATLDARDESFVRYVLQCTRNAIKCSRGPTDDAEEVMVRPGEFFT